VDKPRIGILSTFSAADEAYSLVVVVRTQIEMLLRADYDPAIMVASTWSEKGEWWDGRKFRVIPTAHPDMKAAEIAAILRPVVQEFDVILCHDILFLTQHAQWAIAVRELAKEFPHIAWLNWQHSRGDGQVSDFPSAHAWFCYPNKGDIAHCAQYNKTTQDRVVYVPHALDFHYLNWPNLAVRIAEETGFPFADVSCVMPARLDHQKQIDKLVRLMVGIRRAGKTVSLLIADAYATGEPFLTEKKNLNELAASLGLSDFVFLGERYPDCRVGTPRPVVKALYEMGNLFVQPSTAETSSLVAMESVMAGNLLVLNEDFSPIHHLYKKALMLPFGSVLVTDRKYWRNFKTADGEETRVEDEQKFWDDRANDFILPALNSQLAALVKKQMLRERWPSKVWAEHVEPLIMKAWKEARSA